MTVVASTEAGAEGLGETIHPLADFFYSDDGLVALPQTERLKRQLNVLTYLIERVSLHTNMQKTVSKACRP